MPRARFAEIAARFADVEFFVPVDGALVAASPDLLAAEHQTWALDRTAGCWRLDVFREPHDGDVWICRRDARIRRPYAELIRRTADGVPYLAPEVALLFKAKAARDKDRADFALLSIDTEGSELDILESIDFERIDIDAICVENNYCDPRLRRVLGKRGYDRIAVVGVDEIYRAKVD